MKSPSVAKGLCGLAAVFGLLLPASGIAAQDVKCRDEIRTDRALVRYYTFEGPLSATATIANLAAGGGDLAYQPTPKRGAPAEKFQVVDGHRPGKKALRLDQNILAAEGFPSPGKAFSVESWLRVGGVGTHRGNNESTGGTLLSLGSGYWDGFRLTYAYPSRTIGLEIGRPKPSHSVSIRTEPVPDGVWHHLAATWDGRRMRVYVDGLVAASGEFADAWTTPGPRRVPRRLCQLRGGLGRARRRRGGRLPPGPGGRRGAAPRVRGAARAPAGRRGTAQGGRLPGGRKMRPEPTRNSPRCSVGRALSGELLSTLRLARRRVPAGRSTRWPTPAGSWPTCWPPPTARHATRPRPWRSSAAWYASRPAMPCPRALTPRCWP